MHKAHQIICITFHLVSAMNPTLQIVHRRSPHLTRKEPLESFAGKKKKKLTEDGRKLIASIPLKGVPSVGV
jgi:hypothetical protein